MFTTVHHIDSHSARPGGPILPVHFEVWINDVQIHFDRVYRFDRRPLANHLRVSFNHFIDSQRSAFTSAQFAAERDD